MKIRQIKTQISTRIRNLKKNKELKKRKTMKNIWKIRMLNKKLNSKNSSK